MLNDTLSCPGQSTSICPISPLSTKLAALTHILLAFIFDLILNVNGGTKKTRGGPFYLLVDQVFHILNIDSD